MRGWVASVIEIEHIPANTHKCIHTRITHVHIPHALKTLLCNTWSPLPPKHTGTGIYIIYIMCLLTYAHSNVHTYTHLHTWCRRHGMTPCLQTVVASRSHVLPSPQQSHLTGACCVGVGVGVDIPWRDQYWSL